MEAQSYGCEIARCQFIELHETSCTMNYGLSLFLFFAEIHIKDISVSKVVQFNHSRKYFANLHKVAISIA